MEGSEIDNSGIGEQGPTLVLTLSDLQAVAHILRVYDASLQNKSRKGEMTAQDSIHKSKLPALRRRIQMMLRAGVAMVGRAIPFSEEDLGILREALNIFYGMLQKCVPESSERNGVLQAAKDLREHIEVILLSYLVSDNSVIE